MMMAEAELPSLSSLSLMCPVCLDTFKDPAILIGCGHTYCRGCLKNLLGNAGRNAIMCPECRGITKVDKHGVRTLPPNVSIKKLLNDSKELATRGLHCGFHEFARRDIFCKDCDALLCPLCFADGHTGHAKKTRQDFHQDVHELVELCRERKASIEKRKAVIEQHRVQVRASTQKLTNTIERTFEKKLRLLHENKETLMQTVRSREESFQNDLDGMLARYTQIVDDMEGALALINKESIVDLGEDSLMIHTQQCHVSRKLIEIPYKDSAGKLRDSAGSIQFQEGGKQPLLGKLIEKEVYVHVDQESISSGSFCAFKGEEETQEEDTKSMTFKERVRSRGYGLLSLISKRFFSSSSSSTAASVSSNPGEINTSC